MRGYSHVYILVSESCPSRHYTGCAMDLAVRILKHNSENVPHTAKYRPWRIETAVGFRDPAKAIGFEACLKSGSGREGRPAAFLDSRQEKSNTGAS